MLEKAYMEQKAGKNPSLPLWLSPTQVRLCPVNDSFLKLAEKTAADLGPGMRVDIDDRTESIGKKIRDAEMEWVPVIVVLGEKEQKSGKLAVRFRETGKVSELPAAEVKAHVQEKSKGYPYRP